MRQIALVSLILMSYWNPKLKDLSLKSNHFQHPVKTNAFAILRQKCNSCHASKKRTLIFTLENMDSLSKQIEEQVFLKKKMPKGRKNRLTLIEEEQLKRWLAAIKNP